MNLLTLDVDIIFNIKFWLEPMELFKLFRTCKYFQDKKFGKILLECFNAQEALRWFHKTINNKFGRFDKLDESTKKYIFKNIKYLDTVKCRDIEIYYKKNRSLTKLCDFIEKEYNINVKNIKKIFNVLINLYAKFNEIGYDLIIGSKWQDYSISIKSNGRSIYYQHNFFFKDFMGSLSHICNTFTNIKLEEFPNWKLITAVYFIFYSMRPEFKFAVRTKTIKNYIKKIEF